MNMKKATALIILTLLFGGTWGQNTDQSDAGVGDVTEFESHWFVPVNEDEQESANFILASLAKGMKEPLEMGWFIPPDILIADKKIDNPVIYGDGGQVVKATYSKPLQADGLDKIRQQYGLPCGTATSYFQYSVDQKGITQAGRAVYSADPVPDLKTAYQTHELSSDQLNSVLGALGGKQGFLHRYVAYSVGADGFVIAFNAFYDSSAKGLRKSGIVLLDKKGKALAKTIESYDPSQACKGCGIPTSDDPLERVYDPGDFIQTSLLPYPLVVLKIENSEGKGLSLVTFDTKGIKSEVRAFEFAKDCGEWK